MSDQIYSAKYSGVDVYELIHATGSIMKRKKDDWVNATHILKAANFAKAKRTRILEKEVLKEVHEKVQGGFGKYQGTWVPINVANELARRYNVHEILKPLLDFKQESGSASPPRAPKHHHASRADGTKKRATKSASMSALSSASPSPGINGTASFQTSAAGARQSGLGSTTVASATGSESNSATTTTTTTTTTVVNPVVTRRRGRPPLSGKGATKRKLTAKLQRSQSDMGFPRPAIPNSSISSKQLPSLRTKSVNSSKAAKDTSQSVVTTPPDINTENVPLGIRGLPQYKELDIDDGLSSDIEPLSAIKGDANPSRTNKLDSSGASSPSLPTSPSELSESNPFDSQRFGMGTSPIVSMIPRYPIINHGLDEVSDESSRPPTSDINDKVNRYLSKLVDYFISSEIKSNKTMPDELLNPPQHSAPYIDVPIDPELHTAFHWACSMGTLPIVEALFNVGTSPRSINFQGQTPLMRASMFHNSYTRRTFPKIFQLLHETVFDVDSNMQTVIHHIVKRKSSTPSAVYYLDIVLSKLKDFAPQYRIELLLNSQDNNGDTALHIAAKNADKQFFNTLINNGALNAIPNKEGLTSTEIMNERYEQSKIDTNTRENDKDFMIEDTLMLPQTESMIYSSQAATRFVRGIPDIVSSMKSLAENYNKMHQRRESRIQFTRKNLDKISANVKNVNRGLLEVLHEGGFRTDERDIPKLIKLRDDQTNKLRGNLLEARKKLKNSLEKNQSLQLKSLLAEGGGDTDKDESDSSDGKGGVADPLADRLRMGVELTRAQLRRTHYISEIMRIVEDNIKIHKYRHMISEGTEMAPGEIDGCLNVILQSLETGSKDPKDATKEPT
ncbi:transcription factor MBP1 KNAG_0D04320 [Huiozyma naganishii CBS 8797]|uniref:Transcription factor MBP1 n=1 Tax=Huiozyma naganishii (strain ATCC MYA-139 / BCRC 22969 / CBS 8797 / KCTC 17520 / NBRC 10181 / NCYC 3082 / Yp74L-3) TaxID=1071383 RepID=J7RL03_HUIN7|nr:hypothetical protein KNAG_0D04320 [Kazachstania naganishii CBS 8797]CCK70178.1 hypothetical protein KNAG_0D04320 [Kazachstania naganishii CBS 8797]